MKNGDFPWQNVCSPEGKTIINHPIFDGLYQPFMVILGMVYGIV